MNRSILLDLHAATGAKIQDRADPPQVLTYGDVPGEYEAAMKGCAMLDQTDRGLVRASGADAAAFLHRILANRVRDLRPGEGNPNLLLTSKGKILFVVDLALEADSILLSTSPGRAQALRTALDTYLFSEKVALEDRTADHAPIAVCGPEAARIVREVTGIEPPTGDHETRQGVAEGELVLVTHLPVAGSPGWRLDAGAAAAVALWDALLERGARPAGIVARDSLRVEAGAALDGVDVDENVYPQEARLESAFSLDKGCYVGQEVVAKIDTYGGLNKRLVALAISDDDPVPRGTPLFREEGGEWRELGLATSWAYSFVLDTGLVLAYVKRRHQAVGTSFRVGQGAQRATVVAIPVRQGAMPISGEVE